MNSVNDTSLQPAARDDFEEEIVGDELFLSDAEERVVHCLNSGAAMVWYLCDGQRSVSDIVQELVAISGKSQEEIQQDVLEILVQFRRLGLLKRHST